MDLLYLLPYIVFHIGLVMLAVLSAMAATNASRNRWHSNTPTAPQQWGLNPLLFAQLSTIARELAVQLSALVCDRVGLAHS